MARLVPLNIVTMPILQQPKRRKIYAGQIPFSEKGHMMHYEHNSYKSFIGRTDTEPDEAWIKRNITPYHNQPHGVRYSADWRLAHQDGRLTSKQVAPVWRDNVVWRR
jgi:hypothetical protein